MQRASGDSLVWLLMLTMLTAAPAPRVDAAPSNDETEPSSATPATAETELQRTSDVVHPIYYPHSPMLRRDRSFDSSEVDQLLDAFLHLHTAMHYEEALDVVEHLVELLPDNAVMHYNHACVLGRLHRTDEAIDALDRAIELGWRNLSHMQVDPDLQSLRWSERYESLASELAAMIRQKQPSPGPLREESWQQIVRDLETIAPNLLASNDVSTVTISLVHNREHVWTGEFTISSSGAVVGVDDVDDGFIHNAADEAPDGSDEPRTHRVEAPAQLLAMLGVLEQWDGAGEPGVLRLVKLCRHAAEIEMAASRTARPVGYQSRSESSGVFAADDRRSGHRNRRIVGDRLLRISHVPDDIHDLLRLAVEHLSGESFVRYCRERAIPEIGMTNSELVIVGGRDHRAVRRTSRPSPPEHDAGDARDETHDDWPGPPRLAIETTADDLTALLTHVMRMQRSSREQTMDWQQISDHLLRSCVTRELSIGSGITIKRTPFGLRTDVASRGGGWGCMMRWYPASGIGVVILFDDGDGTGHRVAERLAHLALGGDP